MSNKIENIKKTESPPRVIKNIFNKDEIRKKILWKIRKGDRKISDGQLKRWKW